MAKVITDSRYYSDIANAIRNKLDCTDLFKPCDMGGAIGQISPSESISDGIVVTERDEAGHITAVDCHGTQFETAHFGNALENTMFAWNYLRSVNFINKSEITVLPPYFFRYSKNLSGDIDFPNVTELSYSGTPCPATFQKTAITGISLPKVRKIAGNAFRGCGSLVSAYFPSCSQFCGGTYAIMGECTSLRSVQLGSPGNALTDIDIYAFQGCTQSELTVTVFCLGTFADTAVQKIRNGATNAAIVIKAAEDTSYNGVSYSAGDIMLTASV